MANLFFGKKTMAVAAVMLLAIASSAFYFLHAYETGMTYDGVDRLVLNGYYNGQPLPAPRSAPAKDFMGNMSGNFTVSYALGRFSYVIPVNDSLGSFAVGVYFGPCPYYGPATPCSTYTGGLPRNVSFSLSPIVVISLLGANYSRSGFLGFNATRLSAHDGARIINYTTRFSSFPVKLWSTGSIINPAAREETIPTLGTVYEVNPIITNITRINLFDYGQGLYYVDLQLNLYRITPFGTSFLQTLNITEPWIDISN